MGVPTGGVILTVARPIRSSPAHKGPNESRINRSVSFILTSKLIAQSELNLPRVARGSDSPEVRAVYVHVGRVEQRVIERVEELARNWSVCPKGSKAFIKENRNC